MKRRRRRRALGGLRKVFFFFEGGGGGAPLPETPISLILFQEYTLNCRGLNIMIYGYIHSSRASGFSG